MKTPRPLNFFSTENLATAFHPAWTVLGPSLSRGGHRLRCSGHGSATPAHAAAVASGFFPPPHLSEHRWCFREEPAETLRSFTQTAVESPALCVNAGFIFLPCVAHCFILLHFTLPTPSPAITRLPAQLWPLGTMLAGDTGGHRGTPGAEGMQRECRGEQGRCSSPPPMQGCHINSFPAETLAADVVLWDAVIRAFPACSELPVLLPHPLGCPLLSSSPGLCQAMSPGAFCFSQRGRFAARCQHSGADPYHAAALGCERRAAV